MLRDEQTYHDPEVFNPDRFIRDGKLDFGKRNPLDIVFGFGRRFVFLRVMSWIKIIL
jgi:cytochrome P450